MPGPTRHTRRHYGIRSTHPPYATRHDLTAGELQALMQAVNASVTQFLADAVRGDIQTPTMIVPRRSVLRAIDTDAPLRGLISRRWRQEDPHTHEWIPCTYLCHIASRAITAGDFRYLLLANAMRSATQSLIFIPQVGDAHRVSTMDAGRNRSTFVVLQAHPGGLRFNHAPHGVYPYQLSRFNNGGFLTGYSPEMHNAVIAALSAPGPPISVVTALHAVFQQYCWNGVVPVNAWTAATIWPYYTRGGGTVVTPANFGAFRAAITAEYNAINNDFLVNWPAIANGAGANPPAHW